jgi:hypothetical protein
MSSSILLDTVLHVHQSTGCEKVLLCNLSFLFFTKADVLSSIALAIDSWALKNIKTILTKL